jgi:hypothetical protein
VRLRVDSLVFFVHSGCPGITEIRVSVRDSVTVVAPPAEATPTAIRRLATMAALPQPAALLPAISAARVAVLRLLARRGARFQRQPQRRRQATEARSTTRPRTRQYARRTVWKGRRR